MDDATYKALSTNHQDSIKKMRADTRDYYAGGKRRMLRMKPFIDAFHQGKWIIPKTLLELEFYLNPAALFMNREDNPPNEEVRVNSEDIKLTFFPLSGVPKPSCLHEHDEYDDQNLSQVSHDPY